MLFVALDNVVYPCGAEDTRLPGHEACLAGRKPAYSARVPGTQMAWLENLLEPVPKDRLVALAHHIPLVSFSGAHSRLHQTSSAAQIHTLVQGGRGAGPVGPHAYAGNP